MKNSSIQPRTVAFKSAMILTLGIIGLGFFVAQTPRPYSQTSNDTSYSVEELRKIDVVEVQQALADSGQRGYEDLSGTKFSPELKRPIDWSQYFESNRSLNFNLHAWHFMEADLENPAAISDEQKLKELISYSTDWIKNNQTQLTNSSNENFAWYDMAVGVRSYRLAYILEQSLLRGVGTPEENNLMWLSLLDHFEYLQLDDNIMFHNNHGLIQAAGQKAAARRFEVVSPVFTQIKNQATLRLSSMISEQITAEGIHKEHSPDYHRIVLNILMSMQKEDLLGQDEAAVTGSMSEALWWMTRPNGLLTNFGDSEETAMVGLMKPTGAGPAKTYTESGLAFVKTNDSYLAQQAAFHSRVHKHADDLSFVWFDKGQDILIDAGKYGYLGKTKPGGKDWRKGFWYADPKRQYVEKTRAHNTVEIDNKDYDRFDGRPYGSAVTNSGTINDNVYFAETSATQFGAVQHRRLLVFSPGEWLLVLDNLDDVDNEKHNYKQWFHFGEQVALTQPDELSYFADVSGKKLNVLQLARGDIATGTTKGQKKQHLQGWFSPGPYKLSPNEALRYEQEGDEVKFATLFAFGEEIENRSRSDGWAWSVGDMTYKLTHTFGDKSKSPTLQQTDRY